MTASWPQRNWNLRNFPIYLCCNLLDCAPDLYDVERGMWPSGTNVSASGLAATTLFSPLILSFFLDLFLLLESSPTYINAHNLTFQHKIIKIYNSILLPNMSVVVEGSVSEALDTTTIWKALQDLPKAAREEVEDKNVSQWVKTCHEHLCDVSTSDMILLCQISTSALRLDTVGASWTRLWWQMTAVSCAKISSRLSGRTLGNGLRKPYG